jgi:hypothetical protein
MKKIHGLLLIVGLVIAASISIGCKTVTDSAGNSVRVVDTNLVDRAAVWLRGLASDGALLAVHYDRNAESYLRLSAGVFDGALLANDVSPTTIRKSLTAIPVKELHGELAAIGINTALTAYDAFLSANVKGAIGENYIAKTLLTAIRDGINSALGPPQAMQDYGRQIAGLTLSESDQLRRERPQWFR